MLFKTRAGLSVVTGSFEFYAHQFETTLRSESTWLSRNLGQETEAGAVVMRPDHSLKRSLSLVTLKAKGPDPVNRHVR